MTKLCWKQFAALPDAVATKRQRALILATFSAGTASHAPRALGFQLVTAGLLNKQAGADLGTTEKTIKVHRARVMFKMKSESFAELVRMADQLHIRPANKTH